jgi:hypothetical protein
VRGKVEPVFGRVEVDAHAFSVATERSRVNWARFGGVCAA